MNARAWAMVVSMAGTTLTLAAAQTAQVPSGPDPAEIPIPAITTKMGTLPGVDALPVRREMPNVLTMQDGTRVTTKKQWEKRREEMRRILSYYAVGQMPPAPGNVKGREVSALTVLDGAVRYRQVHLTFGPKDALGLDIGIFTPSTGGPFPAIILQSGSVPGAPVLPRLPQGANQGRGQDVLLIVGPEHPVLTPAGNVAPVAQAAASLAKERADVFKRGYALVVFNPNDCAEDTTLRNPDGSWAFRNTRFYPAYPGYDWGILAGWAWGASRVADYLEADRAIDATKLVITGASRNGKSSMIAAAFDDRLAAAPVVTGGGGIGAYRFAGPRNSETLDIMQKKYPNWFSPHLHQFWGQREKLPFDEHWFLALAAPVRSSRSKERRTRSHCRRRSSSRFSARAPRMHGSAFRIASASTTPITATRSRQKTGTRCSISWTSTCWGNPSRGRSTNFRRTDARRIPRRLRGHEGHEDG